MIRFHRSFCQLLGLFSRYECGKAVHEYAGERHARETGSWEKFVAMLFFTSPRSMKAAEMWFLAVLFVRFVARPSPCLVDLTLCRFIPAH
jgi:hypothetical protein